MIIDLFHDVPERRHWMHLEEPEALPAATVKEAERGAWNSVMTQLRGAFETFSEAVDGGLQHAGVVLEILPQPKSALKIVDVENKGQSARPGDPAFATRLDENIKTFHERRLQLFREWTATEGFTTNGKLTDTAQWKLVPGTPTVNDLPKLYILLFVEKMVCNFWYTSCEAIGVFDCWGQIYG
jgi:hypothetical protein